ncbi:MAG: hypothetical protein ACREP6_05130, partial [Candidatus Binataceae bacterium]
FIFCAIAESYERALEIATANLSRRYAMDFREPAKRYCALGTPADVAAKIAEYVKAGARGFIFDAAADHERDVHLMRLAREVAPLVRSQA